MFTAGWGRMTLRGAGMMFVLVGVGRGVEVLRGHPTSAAYPLAIGILLIVSSLISLDRQF